jgi:hypothetical protein
MRWGPLAALLVCGCQYLLPADWISPEVEPLWTEADLPPLPPDEDNGWVVFGEGIWAFRYESSLPSHIVGLARQDRDTKSPELSWMEARELRGDIEDCLDAEYHLASVSLLSVALSRPRFVDASGISWDRQQTRSPMMRLIDAYQIAVLDALSRATGGSWEGASASAARMVWRSFDLAISSRKLLTRALSLKLGRMSLDLAATLLEGWEAEDGARRGDPGDRTALADLCAAVEAFDPRDIDPWQPMIGEYLGMVELLDKTALRSDDGEIVDMFLYDRDATLYTLNRWFEELERFARAPFFLDRPDFPRPTERSGWWLYNPIGKQLISALGTYYGNRLRDLEADRRDLAAVRDDVLGRCEALGLLASPLTAESLEP